MTAQTARSPQPLTFDWKPQPLAGRFVRDVVDDVLTRVPMAAKLTQRLDDGSGHATCRPRRHDSSSRQ